MKSNEILDESNSILKKTSTDVEFPIKKEYIKKIDQMIDYLTKSQIEEIAEKEDLRPGMGLSAVQIGILKNFFVIVEELETSEKEPQKFRNYIIINPKIVSYSEEIIYAELGEGCLSVNREIDGIVPRYARITVEYQDLEGNKRTIRVREEVSIAFQHEIDHLNGILFFERIEKNILKKENTMRAI